MKDSLQHRFESFILTNKLFTKGDHLLLACSGGVDSVVLCQLLAQGGYSFSIAHCNFQLRGKESDADEAFVKTLAENYLVPFWVKHFNTAEFAAAEKLSIQMAARQLRYEWFNELLKTVPQPALLVTAHHADDSIETVLMNLFKETGISGLHGILPKQDKLVRPLLFARKEEIKTFAEIHQLNWREDASNESDKYTRNFFRLNILPLVEKAIPGAGNNFLKSIQHLKEAESIYLEAIKNKKKKLMKRVGEEWHIPVAKLKLEPALQTIAFEIIKDFGFNNQQLPDMLDLLEADTGKFISSGTHRIIKNRKWLVIANQAAAAPSVIIIDELDKKVLFDGASLSIKKSTDCTISTRKEEAVLDAKKIKFPLVLRQWKQGDYFYPLGMAKKKKIARFLIDQKLSKTEKEKVWVLESNRHIIWVVGHRIDDRFKVTSNTKETVQFSIK